ncbi:hypothetical protein XENORESO_018086 [Xenotaenia resolanae]|uniref:Uncharacterized protein n=1 Tax=Xenotaenia resolanae TaxID=208358 RepID=A0ABV0X144_9TELE
MMNSVKFDYFGLQLIITQKTLIKRIFNADICYDQVMAYTVMGMVAELTVSIRSVKHKRSWLKGRFWAFCEIVSPHVYGKLSGRKRCGRKHTSNMDPGEDCEAKPLQELGGESKGVDSSWKSSWNQCFKIHLKPIYITICMYLIFRFDL